MSVRGSIPHSGLACGYDARGGGNAGSTSRLGTAHRDAFLATIVESTDDAIIGKSLEGIVFSWNAGAERLYGYGRTEMLGKPISRIVPPNRGKELKRIIARLRLGKRVDNLETVRQRKDGTRLHVSLTVSPIISEDGRILGASSIARDITDRRRAQAAERDALLRLRAVVETAIDGIITIDERGMIETVNQAAQEMFGYEAEELGGQNVRVLMPEPYRSEHDTYLSDYARTGERRIIGIGREVSGRRKDGSVFPMDLSVSETRLRGRRMFTGIVRDISSRHKAEQALRESEARFRLMADSAPTLIWMSGVDGACTWLNQRWLEFTGRRLEQELGDGWKRGIHPADLERTLHTYHSAFDANEPFEVEYRRQRFDGEYRWLHDCGVPIRLASGSVVGYVGSCADVTERKHDEETLLERVALRTKELSTANEQLRHQIEQRRRIESLLATENRILELIATGAPQETILSVLCDAIEGLIPDARCAIRLGAGHGKLRTRAAFETSEAVTVDQDLFGAIAADDIYPPLTGETAIVPDIQPGSNDILDRHGVRSYWLEPIVAPGGALVGTLGVYASKPQAPDDDAISVGAMATRLAGIVVERARAEVQAREQLSQLAHVSRLATMGEMATGLAHEINQPLGAIVNFTEACVELIERRGPQHERVSRALGEIVRQAQRAGEVIRRLRAFVSRREPERLPVDINELVREVLAFTDVEVRQSEARVLTKLAEDLPKAFADTIQIEQVLVNLIRNACEAMREGGRGTRMLTIETARHRRAVVVNVSDSGPGISEELKERLFEPFFTTKPSGLGMGLSITRSIIELHDGCLWVGGNRVGGTTFSFTLPACREGKA